MSAWDVLPPNLAELERRLLARPAAKPTFGLRSRVIEAVQGRLRQERRAKPWQLAAAVLVAVMAAANLVAAAGQAAVGGPGFSAGELVELRAAAEQLAAAVPELSEHEALRQVFLLHAGGRVRPVALLPVPPPPFPPNVSGR